MANHKGYIFMSPDGLYLERRHVTYDSGTETEWLLSAWLDHAELFSHSALDPIRSGQGFDEIARKYDVQPHELNKLLVGVPAQSIQKIIIGHNS